MKSKILYGFFMVVMFLFNSCVSVQFFSHPIRHSIMDLVVYGNDSTSQLINNEEQANNILASSSTADFFLQPQYSIHRYYSEDDFYYRVVKMPDGRVVNIIHHSFRNSFYFVMYYLNDDSTKAHPENIVECHVSPEGEVIRIFHSKFKFKLNAYNIEAMAWYSCSQPKDLLLIEKYQKKVNEVLNFILKKNINKKPAI